MKIKKLNENKTAIEFCDEIEANKGNSEKCDAIYKQAKSVLGKYDLQYVTDKYSKCRNENKSSILDESSKGFQKEFYNDYVILKNRVGDGWDIYSYDGTPDKVKKAYLEDEGYATLKDAKAAIDSWADKEDDYIKESIDVATIADYIVDHYDFDDIDDKYSCINSIRDSFKGQKTISEEELEQFIGAHNGKDKVNESKLIKEGFNDNWTQRFSGMNVYNNGDYQI